MTVDWPRRRLGELLRLEYGKSLPERERNPGPIPVVGSAGRVGSHDRPSVQGPGIVIGRKGSIGTVTWVSEPFYPIDTTYYVASASDGTLDLRWAYHLLSRENLSQLNRATGVPGLNRDDVHALIRPVPPLEEQRAMATVLDSIDKAIERTETVIAATTQLREALIHDLLTRGLPGRHSEWTNLPGIGVIPACWKVVRLEEVLESTTYGTNAALNDTGAVPVLRMNNLQDGDIDLSDVRRSDLAVSELDKLTLIEGDILFNRTNSPALVGKTAIVSGIPDDLSFASYLVRLRVRNEVVDAHWLATMLGSNRYQARIRRMATPAVSQANINPTSLRSLTIPLPTLSEQRRVRRIAEALRTRIRSERSHLDSLMSLRTASRDAILTGRVRTTGKAGSAL